MNTFYSDELNNTHKNKTIEILMRIIIKISNTVVMIRIIMVITTSITKLMTKDLSLFDLVALLITACREDVKNINNKTVEIRTSQNIRI